MNKIYSLKYCKITQGFIAVSELVTRAVCKTGNTIIVPAICCTVASLFSGQSIAAILHSDNVWARDYLDLAQNKGIFQPGATDITIPLKNGNTFTFPDVEIPDFSPVANKGATTSIGGAYSVTATHNGTVHHAIATQDWEQTNYNYVDRMTKGDFAVTRLNKFVVETSGVTGYVDFTLSAKDAIERYGVDFNGKKQIIGFRAGAGSTSVISNGKYDTGQVYNPNLLSASLFSFNWGGTLAQTHVGEFYNDVFFGDSGSGLYLYDNSQKKWVTLGTTHAIAYGPTATWLSFSRYDNDTVNKLKSHFTQNVSLDGQEMAFNGDKFTISGTSSPLEMTEKNQNKDLKISGGGTIKLNKDMNLGIGGLIFDENQRYTVTGSGKTFKGAGLDIGKNTIVDWNISGTSGDNLHKIGKGRLSVNVSQGNNLKTGDGTVALNAEKSFNNIYMAGGNSKVILGTARALNNDNEYRGIFFTERGGTLELNGYSQTFRKIAAADIGATITSNARRTSLLSIQNDTNYMYHGTLTGNMQLEHSFDSNKDNSRLILDGNVDIDHDITIKNTQLTMQGHAISHAVFRDGPANCIIPGVLCEKDYAADIKNRESEANKKNGTEYKSNNQVSSFDQPDWNTRTFRFNTLRLENADFSAARNSDIQGDIVASNSTLQLGGNSPVYIDLHDGKNITNDGFSFRQDIREGTSTDTTSRYTGNVTLTNGSALKIANTFTGGISAKDSSVTVDSQNVVLNQAGKFINTPLTLTNGSHITFQRGLISTGQINTGDNAKITLTGIPSENGTYSPVVSSMDSLTLGNNATLEAYSQTHLTGNISADKAAIISLGSKVTGDVSSSLSQNLLQGYDTVYNGAIRAPQGNVNMNRALWQISSASTVGRVSATDSTISAEPTNGFSTLTVKNLEANNSSVVLRTDLVNADKVNITGSASGSNNTLLVNFLKKPSGQQSINIPLVTAPHGTDVNTFKAGTQSVGFSQVTPTIKASDNGTHTQWILDGFQSVPDKTATSKANSFLNADYKNFMIEVNNLNKRMGELRDTKGNAGAWVRIMNGAGSADGGYSDNYTHVQVGFDKKHALDGVDLFTGVTMTYTDSSADSDAFSGKAKSVGGGLYASALFNSGAYIDLIGKYVHHENEYTGNFAFLGTKNYTTHSIYAGFETGYRYHLTEDVFIEPQAELVYGSVSGKTFHWQDNGMELMMRNKDFNPLIGRTGIELGKTFSGNDWSVTARAGTSWQFDLLDNGESVIRDASGEKTIEGKRDNRMLFNIGMNAQIKDNIRFGLELEKSAFGNYNVDNAINANFRYIF
ncbi:autotransporter outer membrane beta-barrel domain-containing protein [Escherichia coli]|nr:autotransporter outer membrane beta-barrel domain-containing protein [Escherichia coli]